jgi:hypothetical protein
MAIGSIVAAVLFTLPQGVVMRTQSSVDVVIGVVMSVGELPPRG